MVSRLQVAASAASEACCKVQRSCVSVGKSSYLWLCLRQAGHAASGALQHQWLNGLQVNAGVDSLKAMCDEIGITKLPYFHFLKGDKGLVAEMSANLTVHKLQQLRLQIAQHHAT